MMKILKSAGDGVALCGVQRVQHHGGGGCVHTGNGPGTPAGNPTWTGPEHGVVRGVAREATGMLRDVERGLVTGTLVSWRGSKTRGTLAVPEAAGTVLRGVPLFRGDE